MIREVSAMDVRKNFGEILNEVKYLKDTFIIKKAGKPIAALIDMELFEKVSGSHPLPSSMENELSKDNNKCESQVVTIVAPEVTL